MHVARPQARSSATPARELDEITWFEDEVTGWSDHGSVDGSLEATPAPAPVRHPRPGRSAVPGALAIVLGMVFGGGAVVVVAGLGTLAALLVGGIWWAVGASAPVPVEIPAAIEAAAPAEAAPVEVPAAAPVEETAPAPAPEVEPPVRMFYGIPVETAIR